MRTDSLAVEVLIDGKEVSPRAVDRLYQREPTPGGHRYVLRVKMQHILNEFSGLPAEGLVQPDQRQTQALFFEMLPLLSKYWSNDRTIEYFLNQIESVEVRADEVTFRGVCSEVVR